MKALIAVLILSSSHAFAGGAADSKTMPVFQCRAKNKFSGDSIGMGTIFTLNAKDAETAVGIVQVSAAIEHNRKIDRTILPDGEVYSLIFDVNCFKLETN